jgi:hypothetical protein
MPTVWMYSFDWDAFEKMLAPPGTAVARQLAKPILKSRRKNPDYLPTLPTDEAALLAELADRLSAANWYPGKAVARSEDMDTVVQLLFHPTESPKRLKLKPLADGLDDDVLGLAAGRYDLDQERTSGRAGGLRVKRRPVLRSDRPELAALGSRPHRFPRWDPVKYEKESRANNPFLPNAKPFYRPSYSIHSPAQMRQMVEELTAARPEIQATKNREALTHYDEDVCRRIAAAADQESAAFAVWDT